MDAQQWKGHADELEAKAAKDASEWAAKQDSIEKQMQEIKVCTCALYTTDFAVLVLLAHQVLLCSMQIRLCSIQVLLPALFK